MLRHKSLLPLVFLAAAACADRAVPTSPQANGGPSLKKDDPAKETRKLFKDYGSFRFQTIDARSKEFAKQAVQIWAL